MHGNTDVEKVAARIERKVSLSHVFLWVERAAQSFWLPAVLTGFAISFIILLRVYSADLALIVVGAVLSFGCVAYIAFLNANSFVAPRREDAIARLDGAFEHTPLAVLHDDLPERASEETRRLWDLHKARSAEAAKAAQPSAPKIRLAWRDRFALRLIAALLLVGIGLFAQRTVVGVLGEGISSGTEPVALGPSFEGWIEPPAYTGEPTYYLDHDSARTLTVPKGSTVLLRVYGDADRAAFSETVSESGDAVLTAENEALGEVTFEIERAGEINLDLARSRETTWSIALTPDDAPSIILDGELERSVDGELRLPFLALDDFGIVEGRVRITLDLDRTDRRHGRELLPEVQQDLLLDLPVGLVRDPKEIADELTENLARHPWANLPVIFELEVTDGAGQVGRTLVEDQDLPGKRFFDPLAAGLIDQRAELLWNRANAARTARLLRAITWEPDDLFTEQKAFLIVRTAIRILERDINAINDEALSEVEDLLWNAAVLIEEGDLNNAAERLSRAQERLSEAMRRGASDEEIAELMQELREAMRDYVRALAQNAEPMDQQQAGQQGQMMSQDQLQEMMDRIQELMEQGRMDEAQQLLNQLMEMMQNMRVVQGGQGGQQGDQNSQSEQLQDTLREQQELADDTFQQLQDEFNRSRQNGQNQPGQQQGEQPEQNGQGTQQGQNQQPGQDGSGSEGEQLGQNQPGTGQGRVPSADELARRQQALQDMLDQQGDSFGGTTPGREALEDAERAMGDAADALDDGDLRGALDSQADAMDALRRGISEMNQAQRQQQQNRQAGGQNGLLDEEGMGDERDPLGRTRATEESGFDQRWGSEIDTRENFYRDLDAEIRKRAGDQTRPEAERNYLKRLLDRF
ncbi:MAG: TIGR02302 family protein [Pseudomonadota bacterium]